MSVYARGHGRKPRSASSSPDGVALLSGGVGGARFACGLVSAAGPDNVAVIGNVGDDIDVLGLSVSPDLDSILYALAGLERRRPRLGPGRRDLGGAGVVSQLGGDDWFALGDRDLGLHLVRTQALRSGERLSAVTAGSRALGIETTILPATDDRLRTWIDTPAGSFPFQEWFVARGHPRRGGRGPLRGAKPLRRLGLLQALAQADAIVIAPSNPYVQHLADPCRRGRPRRAGRIAAPCIAVSPSPLVGRAVKGPADRMLARMAGGTTPGTSRGATRG